MKHIATITFLALAVTALLCGCRTRLAPGGPYTDPILYHADHTIISAQAALESFVKWEYQNRALLRDNKDITKAADYIRRNARLWINSAIAMRDTYAASPTGENKDKLQLVLDMLLKAVTEAQQYIITTSTATQNK